MGMGFLADAVKVLFRHLAKNLYGEVDYKTDRPLAPPLKIQRAAVEADIRHLVLDDGKPRLLNKRLRCLKVKEGVCHNNHIGDPVAPEGLERLVEHILAVQIRLAVSVQVRGVTLGDGHVRRSRERQSDFPLGNHYRLLADLLGLVVERIGDVRQLDVHRVGLLCTLGVRQGNNTNGHELPLSSEELPLG